MPPSAATTGRTAASLRAAIALSAEVSVSTIHSRADVASAPSTSLRQWLGAVGERSALAAQAHGRTVVNLFYEDSPRPADFALVGDLDGDSYERIFAD